jgi:hypothetical protein
MANEQEQINLGREGCTALVEKPSSAIADGVAGTLVD